MADNEVIDLVRRFEPILLFHPKERFFPSDAKRYLEHCALWKAERPFDEQASWKRLLEHQKIAADKLEVFQNPDGTFPHFLGEQQGSIQTFLVDNQNEEHFLELAGWKDSTGAEKNRHANRDEVKGLYDPVLNREPMLVNSRFWYHAEFFDAVRLRELMVPPEGMPQLAPLSDLFQVFLTLTERNPNPALLCYYFFFPAHDESLAAPCDATETGKEFACFAGEWACVAILLGRKDASEAYKPLTIGYTGRIDAGTRQGLDKERRLGMTVKKWREQREVHFTPLPETVGDHPQLFVSLGTHSLYLQSGANIVVPYLPESYPQWCGRFDSPSALDDYRQSTPPPHEIPTAAWAKILGGFLLGGVVGLLEALNWSALEGAQLPYGTGLDAVGTASPPEKAQPDIGPEPGKLGKVVHPKTLKLSPTDFPGADFKQWGADEHVSIKGRTYNFIVDRKAQIWWPSYDGQSGYRGRWGPRVANDPVGRRAGMMFPEFWRMFFIALAKNPSEL